MMIDDDDDDVSFWIFVVRESIRPSVVIRPSSCRPVGRPQSIVTYKVDRSLSEIRLFHSMHQYR